MPDELDVLGSRIVGLSARLASATCRWLLLVAEFDRREGYARWGLASTARWLTHTCGIAHRTAVDHARVAPALATFPALATALESGRISYSHVRAVSRLAHDGEARLVDDLIGVAEHGTVGQLETIVRGLRTVEDNAEATPAVGEYARHGFASRTSHWRMSTRLDPERGVLVEHAIAQLARAESVSATDALVRIAEIALAALQHSEAGPPRGLRGHQQTAVSIELTLGGARRTGASTADAHLDAAAHPDAAARGGAGGPTASVSPTDTVGRLDADTETDSEADSVTDHDSEVGGVTDHDGPRSRARSTAVVVLTRQAHPAAGSAQDVGRTEHAYPIARIVDGPGLPRRVVERLLCACRIEVTALDCDRNVLDLGRRKHVVDDRLFRALLLRDRHCAHPGCISKHRLEAHHVVHWLHGGRTDMINLVLLCSRHHHAHHDGEFSIRRMGSRRRGRFEYRRPDGTVLGQHIDPSSHIPVGSPPLESEYPQILDAATLSRSAGDRLDRAWAVAVLAERRLDTRVPPAACPTERRTARAAGRSAAA